MIIDQDFLDLVQKEVGLLSEDEESSDSLIVQLAKKIEYLSNPGSSENLKQIALGLAPLFGMDTPSPQEKADQVPVEDMELEGKHKQALPEDKVEQTSASKKKKVEPSSCNEGSKQTQLETRSTTAESESDPAIGKDGNISQDLAREAQDQLGLILESELWNDQREFRIHVLRAKLGQLWIDKAVAKATRRMVKMQSIGKELNAWIEFVKSTKLDFGAGEESISSLMTLETFEFRQSGGSKDNLLQNIKYVKGESFEPLN